MVTLVFPQTSPPLDIADTRQSCIAGRKRLCIKQRVKLRIIVDAGIVPEMEDPGVLGRRSKESWMIASVLVTTGTLSPQLTSWKCR